MARASCYHWIYPSPRKSTWSRVLWWAAERFMHGLARRYCLLHPRGCYREPEEVDRSLWCWMVKSFYYSQGYGHGSTSKLPLPHDDVLRCLCRFSFCLHLLHHGANFDRLLLPLSHLKSSKTPSSPFWNAWSQMKSPTFASMLPSLTLSLSLHCVACRLTRPYLRLKSLRKLWQQHPTAWNWFNQGLFPAWRSCGRMTMWTFGTLLQLLVVPRMRSCKPLLKGAHIHLLFIWETCPVQQTIPSYSGAAHPIRLENSPPAFGMRSHSRRS